MCEFLYEIDRIDNRRCGIAIERTRLPKYADRVGVEEWITRVRSLHPLVRDYLSDGRLPRRLCRFSRRF
jgi:hypothetical protein